MTYYAILFRRLWRAIAEGDFVAVTLIGARIHAMAEIDGRLG